MNSAPGLDFEPRIVHKIRKSIRMSSEDLYSVQSTTERDKALRNAQHLQVKDICNSTPDIVRIHSNQLAVLNEHLKYYLLCSEMNNLQLLALSIQCKYISRMRETNRKNLRNHPHRALSNI